MLNLLIDIDDALLFESCYLLLDGGYEGDIDSGSSLLEFLITLFDGTKGLESGEGGYGSALPW